MHDPLAIVEQGYDAIAPRYLAARLEHLTPEEEAFLRRAVDVVPRGGLVLDLGCGPGVPYTAALSAVAHVIGVDLSMHQLRLARERVPTVELVKADMSTFALRPGSVDAVTAFASFGHVPLDRHAGLYRSIASWLRPGRPFVSQHPTGDNPEQLEDDWLGAPMYFSHPALGGTLELLQEAGFVIDEVHDVRGLEDDGTEGHWAGIVARVPA